MKVTDVEIVCKCCGNLFIGHNNRKYCTECRHIKYMVDRHVGYKKKRNEAVDIEISDKTFISDCGVVGMDCEHCPLPDCILEVDED